MPVDPELLKSAGGVSPGETPPPPTPEAPAIENGDGAEGNGLIPASPENDAGIDAGKLGSSQAPVEVLRRDVPRTEELPSVPTQPNEPLPPSNPEIGGSQPK